MAEGVNKLQKLLDDPKITEIMINGSKATFIETEGLSHPIDVKFSEENIKEVIDGVFIKAGKQVSKNHPYADLCMDDGSRLNIILHPLARFGTAITIRKFSKEIKSLEDLLDRGAMSQKMADFLIACIKGKLNMLFSGATGTGKTHLAFALGNHAMANGYSVLYTRVTKLLAQIPIVRGDGSYLSWLAKLAKFKVLILDDFGSCPVKMQDIQELLEIIEKRSQSGSIVITSQLDVKDWHNYLAEPTVADAILDRIIHNSHRINLKGESMRKVKNSLYHSDTFK